MCDSFQHVTFEKFKYLWKFRKIDNLIVVTRNATVQIKSVRGWLNRYTTQMTCVTEISYEMMPRLENFVGYFVLVCIYKSHNNNNNLYIKMGY